MSNFMQYGSAPRRPATGRPGAMDLQEQIRYNFTCTPIDCDALHCASNADRTQTKPEITFARTDGPRRLTALQRRQDTDKRRNRFRADGRTFARRLRGLQLFAGL